MNRTTYLVAIPNWALATLVSFDYRRGRYPGLTNEQSCQLNDWLMAIDPNDCGFILHDPEEGDQSNAPVIPCFGGLCPATICYISIYHD
jgi:hypothetical protein